MRQLFTPHAAKFRALRDQTLFVARLGWRIGGRALALLPMRKTATAPPDDPTVIGDYDQIIEALQVGNTAVLERLGPQFAASADDFIGQPWFFNAIDLGNLASLRWFLAQGVALDGADKAGRSPLQAAIERAAAPDLDDETPEDPLPMIEALLDAGAEINAASRQGLTALHVAAALGLCKVVRLLLARGANPGLRDEGFAGAAPFDYAVQAGHADVAELLRAV
ncbi:MAG: Ankyrin [Cypionkella sp.]|uniref:ankyrin repeat domain-containing protein n=1 Tax=Cypionkella sp. TaxID=2811411 RepID=UPI00262046EC|nr:ankyrin repeat domain-containing protein [Cypionkella sp.]MDB5661068.1 Ankyrin [Cypionkella sp.]